MRLCVRVEANALKVNRHNATKIELQCTGWPKIGQYLT